MKLLKFVFETQSPLHSLFKLPLLLLMLVAQFLVFNLEVAHREFCVHHFLSSVLKLLLHLLHVRVVLRSRGLAFLQCLVLLLLALELVLQEQVAVSFLAQRICQLFVHLKEVPELKFVVAQLQVKLLL